MSGLFRNNPDTPEGKYLVQRRDATIPEWPYFVIGAKDPCSVAALKAYVEEARRIELDSNYIDDISEMINEWESYIAEHGPGDPDGAPHRTDDLDIVEK